MIDDKDILVSVIIPSYNHDKYIEQAIRSVWTQSYNNIELIVIDDGSKDSSWSIINNLLKVSPLKMIIDHQTNQGLCKTLNKGILKASGELIALLASDDYYHHDFINRNVQEYLKHRGNMVVFHSDAYNVDENSIVDYSITNMKKSKKSPGEGKNVFYDMLYLRTKFISPTFVVPKYVYEITGLYDEALKAEDFDMHLRQARVAKFVFIDEALFFKRQLEDNLGSRVYLWADDTFVSLEKHREYLGKDYNKILKIKLYQTIRTASIHNNIPIFSKYLKKIIGIQQTPLAKLKALFKSTFILIKYKFVNAAKKALPSFALKSLQSLKYKFNKNHG